MSMTRPLTCAVLAVTSSTAFLDLNGIPNLVRAYGSLKANFPAEPIFVASSATDEPKVRAILKSIDAEYEPLICEPCEPTSLLQSLYPHLNKFELILIHDAARPLTNDQQFEKVIAAFTDGIDAVRPVMAFTETLKILGADSIIKETLDRATVLRISTPELIRVSATDSDGSDCGWFLPLKKNAKTSLTDGTPDGLRINSAADRDLMELYQD